MESQDPKMAESRKAELLVKLYSDPLQQRETGDSTYCLWTLGAKKVVSAQTNIYKYAAEIYAGLSP